MQSFKQYISEFYTIGHTRFYDANANRAKENLKGGSTDPMDKKFGTKLGASKGQHGGVAFKNTEDATKGAHGLKKEFPGYKYSVYKLKGDFDKDTYYSKKTGMNHVKRNTEISHKALHNVTESSEELNESALTALRVATKAHKGQFRKSGGEYIVHPKEVARFVKQFKKSNNLSTMIQAAYLHDTLEDTDTTYQDLVKQFGALVADMVQELTTDKAASDAIGKGEYIANKMAKMSSWALVVKLADRLANVQDIDTRPADFQKKYAAQTVLAINRLRKDRYLSQTHNKIISAIEKKIKEYIPKTVKEDTAELRKKYQNHINAEEKLSDHDYGVNKAKVTRTANTLSKAINKHLGPDATIQDKINLRTRLQNGK